jgi:hypothetical protein
MIGGEPTSPVELAGRDRHHDSFRTRCSGPNHGRRRDPRRTEDADP